MPLAAELLSRNWSGKGMAYLENVICVFEPSFDASSVK